jgi:3-deoxy-manno-octulosonate cytidylyltransferase (CMP-KDO synthetase)
MLRALGVIPARYASTRFPGKPLAPLGNGSLLYAVWSKTVASSRLTRVVVATEDDRIVEACRAMGAEAMLTSTDHASGTDRAAEVVRRAGESFEVVVNIQGDEPFVTPTALDRLVAASTRGPEPQDATLAEPLGAPEELFDPASVKVVTANDGSALYFSRAPIPYHRGSRPPSAPISGSSYCRGRGGYGGYLKPPRHLRVPARYARPADEHDPSPPTSTKGSSSCGAPSRDRILVPHRLPVPIAVDYPPADLERASIVILTPGDHPMMKSKEAPSTSSSPAASCRRWERARRRVDRPILEGRGFKITMQKLDPYINVDPAR